MLSLNKLHGNGRSAYEVSCKLPDHVIKSRRFDCSDADDFGAHTNAIRFAKAAETVPEFRAFLFSDNDGPGRDQRIRSYVCMREKQLTGGRYAVAMCRLESGHLRSISFLRGTSGDDAADARGRSQVIGKAEQFLRSVAFEDWRKQVSKDSRDSKESLLKSREHAGGNQQNSRKERALKHPHSFVERDQGEKVDCKCGKNRSHGLMVACERCSAWEHAECQGFRSKKQIPADYICSACVRAEREEVIIIRCEEQGKYWSISSEDTHAGMTFRQQEDGISVCCVCGCEDNEYFEPLVQPCSCTGCSLLAHTSCITTVKVGALQKEQRLQRSGVCCFCGNSGKDGLGNETKLQKGGRWVEEVLDTKQVKGDQQGVARKRLRSTSSGSAVPVKAEPGEKPSSKSSRNDKGSNLVYPEKVQPEVSPTDLKKSSSPFLGRRFSDAAANVPIKKRRIQLEMARSPSPPPGSLKPEPGIAADDEVLEVMKPSGSQISEEINSTVATESDGNRGGSFEPFAALEVPKFDSEAPAAVLNISEEDLAKGDTQMNPPERVPEIDPKGGIVVSQNLQLGQLDLVVGCKSKKGNDKSQLRKGNRCVTENGTTPASTRRKEGSNLVSQVDAQLQILPIPTGSTSPTIEGAQARVMSEHLLSPGLSKMGRAGQSEDVFLDSSREGGAILSPNSKRKFSETDMSQPFRDHLRVGETSRSRPVNRAGNVNVQTSIVGSTAEEHIHTLAPHASAMMEASTLVEKNNSLRDDRLHWDLNMDMEEWERPSEEDNAVTMAQNLSSISNTEMEKMESLHAKKFDQASQKDESGAAVSRSTSFEDGRLEKKSPPEDSADPICEFNAAEVSGASLTSEMQVERKDEISLTSSDACNTSFTLAEDQLRESLSPISFGGIVDSRIVKRHDFIESELEKVCNSLQGDKSISALQKDNQHTELEVAPAPGQEAEALHCEEPPSVIGLIVDKETKGRVFLVAEKGRMDLDVCSSELTELRPDTSCVHEEEDICGTQITENSSEAADILHSEKKLGSYGEHLGQLIHSEGVVISTHEPTSAVPVAESIYVRNVTELQGYDDVKEAPHDDENLVDKEVVEEFTTDKNRLSTSPSRQPAPLKWEGDNGEDLEADDVDYGDSDLREGDDHDVEDRLQRGASEVESTWNSYGETKISEVQDASASHIHTGDADDFSNVMGTRKRRYGGEITSVEESQGMDNEKAHAVLVDNPNSGSIPGKSSTILEINGGLVVEEEKVGDEHGNGSVSVATSDSLRTSLEGTEDLFGTARSGKVSSKSEVWRGPSEGGSRVKTKSGWDQLPEGFQSAEEALQAVRLNAGQTGWGSHYGAGFSGWNGNPSIHFGPSENRYLPGHGRGMLPGPAAERAAYEKTAWSRGDHPRRSRVDDGLEMHGRVPVNQELRQSSGSRGRPSSLEPAHRQRRRGIWGDDAGAPPPMWGFGPGRHLSPPGPSREPYGFHLHKTRNAAAVAAAKVESSGLVVAPDGTVIKAGVGVQAPLRGLGGKGRGGGFSSMGDMTSNGLMTGVGNTGLSHSLRIAGDVDLRSRECLGVNARVAGGIGMGTDASLQFKRVGERFGGSFPPGMGSAMARGAPGMLGTSNRYRWTREERSFVPPVEQEDRIFPGKRRSVDTCSLPQPSSRSKLTTPPRSTTSNEAIPDDGAASELRKTRGSQVIDTKVEVTEVTPEVTPAESDSPALQVVPPPPKLPLPPPPPRAQRSPPAGLKRLINKREVDWPRGRERSRDKDREWDRERASSRGHYSPSRRSSPHVIHGSALTDERDRLLLAGIDRSRDQGASASVSIEDAPSYRGRSMEDVHEARRVRHYDGRKQDAEDVAVKSRAQCKDSIYRSGDAKELRSETDLKADRARIPSDTRSDTRRDCQKSGANYKHSSSRDGEDDVAPRRRRPS